MIKPIMPVEYGKCTPTVKLVAIVHAHSETFLSRVIRVHLIVLTKTKKRSSSRSSSYKTKVYMITRMALGEIIYEHTGKMISQSFGGSRSENRDYL